ncbi:hypothetical protein M5F03_03950 [Acinetobacter sp. ANC 5579]|uniref:hypothetical protein n=1 Tax=Acinetobacter amyesii TaxID=2942470 RepID=UPI0020BF585A|nr:hypothetical protein [Acinetobacter amyesii]MCL6234326.1 hypothetical protein [Acinetobacter amyesii]
MNSKNLIIGISITVVWFLVIGLFCVQNNFVFTNRELNSLGDFLAGIFAPVAFLWLILGYLQQGKQLDQNTKALEQQEKALQLQIEEMKNGLEQQKQLVQTQKEQQLEQRKQLSPKIFISDFHARAVFGNDLSADNSSGEYIYNNVVFITIYFNLENLGEEAYHFKIIEKNSLECLEQIDVLKRSETYKIKLHLSTKLVDQLNLNKILDEFFNLSYECKNGVKIQRDLFMQLYPRNVNSPFFHVNMYLDD